MTKGTGCAEKAKAALLALARESGKIKAAGSNSAKFQTLEQRTLFTARGEALQQAAQRPGQGQGQLGQGSEQPGPVEDVPAHGRGLE